MKIINKMIRNTIIEIVVVIVIVIISVPIWKSFDLREYETIASNYNEKSNIELEVSDLSDYVLYQISDELAINNIKPINIRLINSTTKVEEYHIFIAVSKDSTLDYSLLKIKYLDEIKMLHDCEMFEDNDYYYFSLSVGKIASDIIDNNLLLWIDSKKNGDIHNKYLNFDIINITGQTL